MSNKLLRERLVATQLAALEAHTKRRWPWPLSGRDRLHLARASEILLKASRLEEGLPSEINVMREGMATVADAIDLLAAEEQEAEEEA
jgi:hypothetical protein